MSQHINIKNYAKKNKNHTIIRIIMSNHLGVTFTQLNVIFKFRRLYYCDERFYEIIVT